MWTVCSINYLFLVDSVRGALCPPPFFFIIIIVSLSYWKLYQFRNNFIWESGVSSGFPPFFVTLTHASFRNVELNGYTCCFWQVYHFWWQLHTTITSVSLIARHPAVLVRHHMHERLTTKSTNVLLENTFLVINIWSLIQDSPKNNIVSHLSSL